MSLPLNIIQNKTNELDENDIWMLSLYDRYKARPLGALFEEMCYASFCSQYRILSASQIPKNPEKCGVFKLQNDTGYLKKRTRTESAVVRYLRFSKEKSPEMYYQGILQLFLPHRLEAQLKPQQFTTYEEMYSNGAVILPVGSQPRNVKNIVEENRQLFEKNAEDLDRAQEMIDMNGPLEDAWALIAPETEAERLEGQQEREQHNEECIMEIPELDNSNSQKSHRNDIEFRQLAFPVNVVKSLMRQMNKEQRDVFNKVRAWCIDTVNGKNPKPFQVFISGGAGTGKSHLIKCLFYESTRILSPLLPNPDDIPVLLTASTATAAFNIGGTTLHQCFSLPKCLPLPYVYLRDSQLNKLRSKLQHVFIHVLIIDEISMVGQRVLLYISERLRQIKQSGNALFGNICVIAVGDFYQIPPVRQLSLWDCRPQYFFPLWSNCFSLVELKQIMRQKDDALFAQLLNRLRVRRKNEPLSSDDLALLKSCESHTVPADTLYILSTLKMVTAHNNQMLETVCQSTVSIAALDLDKDAKTGQLTARKVPFETKSDSLPANLVIGLKAKVMRVRNTNVANGLVNGSVGTVCEILPPKDRHSMPEGVMVLFDSERIHSDATNTNKHLPIKIEPFEETLSNGTIRHYNFLGHVLATKYKVLPLIKLLSHCITCFRQEWLTWL